MAELDKNTIAYELSELASARKQITEALSTALTGTNAQGQEYTLPFVEYGNLIKTLTAINIMSCQDGNALDLNNLYSNGRATVYYIDDAAYWNKGKTVANTPAEMDSENFWLLSLCVNGKTKTQIAWYDYNATHGEGIYFRNGVNSTWSEWSVLSTDILSIVSSNYYTKTEVDNKIKNAGATSSGTSAPTGDGQVGQIYVDTANKNVYIYDGSVWQLMNSWQ